MKYILSILTILIGGAFLVPVQAQEINQTDEQGRKQGEWVMKKPDGTLVYEGRFVDDQPVGTFKRYYAEGGLKAEMNYRSPRIVYSKLYYPAKEQVLMAEGKYISQEKDSVWLSYDPSGQLKSMDTYKKGVRQGRAVVYHENGEISEETTYVDGERHGEWKRYYPDGTLMAKGTFENGERVGEYLKNYPNGKMWVKGEYINGFKESTWLYGNENGSLGQMVVYRKGEETKQVKMNGTFTEYYEPERPQLVENYQNGKLDGPYIEYYDNGEWVQKQVDKRPEGGEIEIYRVLEGQQIKKTAQYKNGELHGKVVEYDEKGNILSEQEYVSGELKE